MTEARTSPADAAPQKLISTTDAVAFAIGVVVGIGIFRTPPLVAANAGSEAWMIGAWLLGGLAMLTGMLTYAELAASRPNVGGEYDFLRRAYGHRIAVLFAWARGTVIQTGAIAAVAFVFGEYAQQVLPLGVYGPTIWAIAAVVLVTAVNLAGTVPGKTVQVATAAATVLLVAVLIGAAFLAPAAATAPAASSSASGSSGAFGLAMVFVLLTYGGWNEIAYLSGEMKDVRRTMLRTAIVATAIVTLLYVAVNLAYLHVLGFEALKSSRAVGADAARVIAGAGGSLVLAVIVCVAALSTLNATVFTGARVYYALGRDVPLIAALGTWNAGTDNPRNAFLLQAAVSLVLIGFGAMTRDGFSAMVDYTAPVFWLFLLAAAVSLFVLRRTEPGERPFRVPLYPLTPLVFAAVCAYLLYSSVMYTGLGALFGLAVLATGLPLAFAGRRQQAD